MTKRTQTLNIVIICLIALLVLLAAGILFLSLRRAAAPAEEPGAGNEEVPAWTLMPRNELDPALFSTDGQGWKHYDAPGVRCGIDVSSWQGEIDWAQVAAAGVDFAILQLGYRGYTEGALNPDARFSANLEGAKAAGIAVGVYFFSQAVSEAEAREEAAFVLDALDGTSLDLPVFFDWEYISDPAARTYSIDGEQMTLFANAFCAAIQQGGYASGVYFNRRQGYIHYDLTQLTEHLFWLAEYSDTPTFYYAFRFWQYTDQGQVPGIEGSVDLNLWFPET